MRKLSRDEATVCAGWMVAYLLSGISPTLSILTPGLFSILAFRSIRFSKSGVFNRRSLMSVAGLLAIAAILAFHWGKVELTTLLGTLSLGIGTATLGRSRVTEERGDAAVAVAWLVAGTLLALVANAISGRALLGTASLMGTLVLGALATACGIQWFRSRLVRSKEDHGRVA